MRVRAARRHSRLLRPSSSATFLDCTRKRGVAEGEGAQRTGRRVANDPTRPPRTPGPPARTPRHNPHQGTHPRSATLTSPSPPPRRDRRREEARNIDDSLSAPRRDPGLCGRFGQPAPPRAPHGRRPRRAPRPPDRSALPPRTRRSRPAWRLEGVARPDDAEKTLAETARGGKWRSGRIVRVGTPDALGGSRMIPRLCSQRCGVRSGTILPERQNQDPMGPPTSPTHPREPTPTTTRPSIERTR